MAQPVKPVRHYDAQYGRFSSELYASIRREAFGEDIGQNSWLTSEEHDLFIEWMSLTKNSRVLDIACGSGHTTLRIAAATGCTVYGVDIHENAIEEARGEAAERGFASRATFQVHDASKTLPFDTAMFDALICIDAINHLPDRPATLLEWARVLKPGSVLVFTDPIVVSGPLTAREIAIRSSIGFFLFVPPGVDERLLVDAGFIVNEVVDRTRNMAKGARGRLNARQVHESDLRQIEGDETFEGQQRFLEVAARLAEEDRLSRLAFRATRR